MFLDNIQTITVKHVIFFACLIKIITFIVPVVAMSEASIVIGKKEKIEASIKDRCGTVFLYKKNKKSWESISCYAVTCKQNEICMSLKAQKVGKSVLIVFGTSCGECSIIIWNAKKNYVGQFDTKLFQINCTTLKKEVAVVSIDVDIPNRKIILKQADDDAQHIILFNTYMLNALDFPSLQKNKKNKQSFFK